MDSNFLCNVQIIGTQRSGSNLLRILLNQHSKVAAPHPPHILKVFMPYENYYINKFDELLSDVCTLVNTNPVKWFDFEVSKKDLLPFVLEKNLGGILHALYDFYANCIKKEIWVNKSMFNLHYFKELQTYSEKKYIYIYRDGRDVACSFQKTPVGHKHFYFIAKQWQEDQKKALEIKNILGEDKFFSIKYEDLISNSEKIIEDTFNFLGVPKENISDFYKSNEAQKTAKSGAMWSNVQKPIMQKNTQKFKDWQPLNDIKVFEAVAGTQLLQLGYNLMNVHIESIKYSKEKINGFRILNEQAINKAFQKLDNVDIAKRSERRVFLNFLENKCIIK